MIIQLNHYHVYSLREKSHVKKHKGRNDHPRPEVTSNPYRVLWGFKESKIERERGNK